MPKNKITYEDIHQKLVNPKTSMTDEMLKQHKKEILDSLSYIRHQLITRPGHAFIGGILMRMEIVPVRDYRCNTAMTDGTHIFFDIDFFNKLNEEERKFVLAHEVWHVIYMHFLRQNARETELWNIATDCEINYMLRTENFTSPEQLCYPDKEVEGKNAEEIYEYLLKKAKKQNKNSNMNNDSPSGGSNGKGNFSGQFDDHYSENENDVVKLPSDQWGEKGIDKDFTPRISQDASERIREMVISEAQRYERTQGKLPSYLENVINRIRKPEINWREYLAQFVSSCIGDRRVWLPPNRHYVWSGGYFQSRRGEKIEVVVTVDTSGSTTCDLPKFMAELINLLETFGNYEMTVIQCDAEVHDVSVYDASNEYPINNPELIKWKGFGGSDLNPAFDEIIKRSIQGSLHIVFTDGYIDVPKKNPLQIPTLFVLTSDGDENLCDWGEKVKFKEKIDE